MPRDSAQVRMLCRDMQRGKAAREDFPRDMPGATLHADRRDVGHLGPLTSGR